MGRSWTFGTKLGIAFAIAVIALAAVAVVGYRTTKALIANNERVAHTQSVRKTIADLMIETLDAETGVRGFVITGRPEHLGPYEDALKLIDTHLAMLRTQTADNTGQQQRIARLEPALDARLAHLARVVELRRTSFEGAIAEMSTGEGVRYMSSVRDVIGELDAEEARLMKIRSGDAEDGADIATTAILWGSVAAIAVTILVAWVITRSLGRQIGGIARSVQSSASELQTAANQQASGATEQATAMTEITTTIVELLATSRQIADSSRRVAHIATETASAARTGTTTVARGSEAVASVRRQVDAIVGHMVELGKKSQQVGVVLDIVSELAEQTNILAINATIEAAGAGDAGRRFGVVADEIRKLADRVTGSTKEIRAMIEDVRSAVNTTVMATEAGSKAVEVGAGQVTEMATSFAQIAGMVTATTDAAREIELSTKQQASAVEQVNVAITNVAQASREAEASTSQTLQTSAQLSTLSTDLVRVVQSAG